MSGTNTKNAFEFSYKSRVYSTTGLSHYLTNHGREPPNSLLIVFSSCKLHMELDIMLYTQTVENRSKTST